MLYFEQLKFKTITFLAISSIYISQHLTIKNLSTKINKKIFVQQ